MRGLSREGYRTRDNSGTVAATGSSKCKAPASRNLSTIRPVSTLVTDPIRPTVCSDILRFFSRLAKPKLACQCSPERKTKPTTAPGTCATFSCAAMDFCNSAYWASWMLPF